MRRLLQILLPLLILLAAFGIFKWLGSLKPPSKSRMPAKVVPHAEIIEVSPDDHRPPVRSFGAVQPYFETILTPQVSGRIEEIAPEFRVGSRVARDTVLARIDATDYRAALAREQANLANAERALAEEKIRAKQAAEDWVASGRKIGAASDFVLRKPQLAAATSAIASARAAVQKATADMERTQIRAPYNAVVTGRNASVGNFASPQAPLGKLVATDRAEVRLPLTAGQAARIKLPGPGAPTAGMPDISLTTPAKPGASWRARIVRVEPTVDPRNQVSYVIAEVSDPYASGKPSLPVGTFANATIPGEPIPGTFRIPGSALVNDAVLWTVTSDNQLARLDATRVYSLDGDVFVSLKNAGVSAPLRVVVRPLVNFQDGMEVKPVTKEK